MKHSTILKLRQQIRDQIPQDYLQLKPGEGHIYYAPATGTEFISTTTKNQIISNPIYQNWRMNRMAEYLFDHKDEITKDNFDDFVKQAKEYPEIMFKEAGRIGNLIHAYAHDYFTDWINKDERPADILAYVNGALGRPKEPEFIVWSALRSLQAWVLKNDYIPLASELKVWNEKYHSAGTIDNVGVINGKVGLPDWKSSNNFRDDYWIQLGDYYGMFYRLTHIRCSWGRIIKFVKTDGSPAKEEVLDSLPLRWRTARTVQNLFEDIQLIRNLRKPDNKVRL
jgi:hypothetical protein